MALSRVGGSSAAATSIAIPAHVAGDLIVIWAFRDGSTAIPTVPTAGGTVPAFTTIDGPTGANTCAAVCAWAVATGTTDTSGTWTNATGISVEVWRGASSVPIGDHAQSGASVSSGGNVAIPALTLQDPGGNSVVLAFAGWRTVTAWNAAPAGYTQRSQVATECEALSKNTPTSAPAFNVSGTASGAGGTRTQQLEILADLGNRVSQETVEVVYTTTGATARVSQEVAEVLYATGAATARVSQEAVEVLGAFPTGRGNRVSQVAVETLIKIPKRFVATLAGVGTLTATIRGLHRFTATLAGTSALSAVFNAKRSVGATLAGVGHLAASVAGLKRFTATLAGAGHLVASITGIRRFTATLSGRGSLTATVSTGGGVTQIITATLAGTSSLRASLPYRIPSGVITLDADAPNVFPYYAISDGVISLDADSPTQTGTTQVPSGTIFLLADPPGLPAAYQPATGVITLAADAPRMAGAYQPISGRISLAADPPTVYPVQTPSAKILLKATGPVVQPVVAVPGRILLRADGPNVFPIQAPSGVILLRGTGPTLASYIIVLSSSGIIRLRADAPIVTPLTEPVAPPPTPPGTGIRISGNA